MGRYPHPGPTPNQDDMGRFRNPFDLGYLGNLLDFWTRAGRIESNPYHYTQLYQGKQPDAHPPEVRVRV